MTNPTYAAILIVSGTIALIVAGLAWRGRSAPGATALVVLTASMAIWSWMYAWFWLATDPQTKRLAIDLAYIGVFASTPAFLVMAIRFSGNGHWLTPRALVILSVLPAVSFLILLTDPSHHLYFGEKDITDPDMLLDGGPWFWFHVAYSSLMAFAGLALLVRAFVKNSGLYRRQAGIVLAGMLFPWIAVYLGLAKVTPFQGLDLTPVAFTITSLLFAYGFFGHSIMDLAPVGRDVLFENLEDGIVVMDLKGRVVDLNTKAMAFADPKVKSPIGKPIETVFSDWKDYIDRLDFPEGRLELKLDRAPFSTLDVRFLPLRDRRGQMVGQVASWRDISDLKQIEEQLRIFFHAVSQNPVCVLITDPDGIIEYVNPQFTFVTGYTLDEVRGKNPRFLKSGETSEEVYQGLWETIKRGETWELEILNHKRNGEGYWAYELIAPVLDDEGKVTHFVAMQQDITERKRTESELQVANTRLYVQLAEIERLHDQLREEAIRDSLTRLFNRRYLEETLDRELSRADRAPAQVSVVMMDVDRFKTINDTFGHQAGDTVLQTLGTMLLENTRISDIACRFGGDEMLVVLPGAGPEDALARAEEWRAAFSLMEFSFGEMRVRTTLSLGVAVFPEHAKNPTALLIAADKSLYWAKIRRNSVQMYDPTTMQESAFRSDDVR